MLRDIESKLAGLVEGTFGRLFRSEVTPAELARGLAREMESTQRSGVDRVWAAPEYDVYLSPADFRRLGGAGPELAAELSNSLLLHAREQRLALAHTPVVRLHREDDLPTGQFGVRATHAERAEASAPRRTEPVHDAPPVERPRPVAVSGGPIALVLGPRRDIVPRQGGVVGRSRECEIQIPSPEISRRHAEIRPDGDGWVVYDLGSTNGVRVNGRDVGGSGHPLAAGDRLRLGTVELRVEAA